MTTLATLASAAVEGQDVFPLLTGVSRMLGRLTVQPAGVTV